MLQIAAAIILGCCALGAGLCTGFGAIGPGIGAVTSTMIMGCAVAETTGIYSLVISILLIFVAPSTFINILKSL